MISDNKILLFLIGLYLYNYGPPHIMVYFLFKTYHFSQSVFTNLNKIIYPDYWNDESDNNSDIKTDDTPKLPPKYEDKYIKDIRNLNKDWLFTDDEQKEELELTESFFNGSKENITIRMEELNKICSDLERDIKEDTDDILVEDSNEGSEPYETTLEERNTERTEQINEMIDEYNKIKLSVETEEGLFELKEKAKEHSIKIIAGKRLDKLDNCYVMEKTPQGNVLMMYNKVRESFNYYSDSTIPYRYLEVVARKYVKFFDCRPIFIDMEEELKLVEEKWEKNNEQKRVKEEQEKEDSKNNIVVQVEDKKKNVFTKFKSYNKDAGGKISMAAPPKNSIPNNSASYTKEDEKIMLKEKANRYTYEGKFANFNFLKKTEKKVFNKKLGLTFADFKKIQQEK